MADQNGVNQIEQDVLRGFDRTLLVTTSVAVVCLVSIIAMFVLAADGTIGATPAAVGIPCAFVAFCAASAMAVHARMVLRIGHRHGWQRVPCAVQHAGRGRSSRVEVVVERFVHLQPWDGSSNSRKLLGQTVIDMAGDLSGDLSGKVLLRVPETSRIFVFRAS